MLLGGFVMRKRWIAGLLAVCLTLLTACAGSGSTENTAAPAEWDANTTSNEVSETSAPETSEPVVEKVIEPIIEAQYPISNILTGFFDDRAWVSYYHGNVMKYALIDQNGFIIYSTSNDDFNTSKTIGVTNVKDGMACAYANGRLIMLDKDGNVLFDSKEDGDDHDYTYMGRGNGIVLAIDHVSNFSEDAKYVCQFDFKGQLLQRLEMPEDFNGGQYSYIGESIFARQEGKMIGSGYYSTLYNYQTNSVIELWGELNKDSLILADFSSGFTFYRHGKDVYKIPAQAFTDNKTWAAFDLNSALIDKLDGTYISVSDGYIVDANGVYDYNASTIASFPENWDVIWLEPFSGGYAAVGLRGTDTKYYFTVIDTEGNAQFDPIKYDYNAYALLSTWHGYVSIKIDKEAAYFDPTGKQITELEYKLLQADAQIGESGVAWMRIETGASCFTGENNSTLDTVYIVSNYDEVAGQIYSPQNSGNSMDNNPTEEKEYQFPSSYSIEGKWKNVGTYTFGQVGAGAIVVFDGTHCNFYSPSDTYAFYEKQLAYKLDITSALGETLSFVVRIVDENNIDIYNGSNYLELTRVE